VGNPKKLRLTTRFQEINDILSQSLGKENCFIWKANDKKREKFAVTVQGISESQDKVYVRQSSYSPGINPDEIVFLKIGYRDAALKTRVVERIGAKITLEFPSQLALEEGRKDPRFYFHPSDEKIAVVKTLVSRENSLPEKTHHSIVCDMSRGGMAIYVPSEMKLFFEVGQKVRVTELGTHRFEEALKGEILFRVPVKIKSGVGDRAGFKLGMSFEKEMDPLALERFVQKKNLFSINEEQIVRDEAFRRSVQSNMAEIKKTISGRKSFREIFEAYEVARSDNHYLKQHVHLLCQVLPGLGTRLGWISERSIDKLIYVAYLHDIRLAMYPHLARIPSKKHFEKIKHTLSEPEQKAFLEAPAYAAEIARQDLESYPDAIKMLMQQKEVPDGSGFPHGLTSSLIAPLSALFIVSHHFVDYVIDHPDWTTADFVKSHQNRLKGQYFQKVLQAIKG